MTEAALQSNFDDLPTSPETLLAYLNALSIDFTLYHHKAVFTVAESNAIDEEIPGTHCRNLFLRDRKKKNFLLVLQNDTPVDIKKLPEILGCDKLSFGSPERLWEHLGVRPGSVCPYAIINDKNSDVEIFLDAAMLKTERVNYHPLVNTMTISTTPQNLLRFIESCGHTAHIVDLSSAAPAKED